MPQLFTVADRKKDLLNLLELNQVSLDLFPYRWLCTTDFFEAPASRGFHSAYPGGLYDHSINVALQLVELSNKGITNPWCRIESPFIIGILHDVTKIGAYKRVSNDIGTYYEKNPLYSTFGGHGYDSVCKIEQHMELTEEEHLCIQYHMGAYQLEDWDGFDKAIKAYPNVLWTHTADMIASKLLEV